MKKTKREHRMRGGNRGPTSQLLLVAFGLTLRINKPKFPTLAGTNLWLEGPEQVK